MDSSFGFDVINLGWSIGYTERSQLGYNFHIKCIFLSLKIVFLIANSVDPDEILHYTAFHLGLGLRCLPNIGFIQAGLSKIQEPFKNF